MLRPVSIFASISLPFVDTVADARRDTTTRPRAFDERRTRSLLVRLSITTVLFACSPFAVLAAERCAPDGADAAALADNRSAIDSACDCELALKPGDYRGCAKSVVKDAVDSGALRPDCRREALRYSKLSRCGTDDVVCCRLDADNETRQHHRVLDASSCVSDSRYNACISNEISIVTGCNASGCVTYCGDGIISGGEQCDPPGYAHCDDHCRRESYCGDGILDAGEQCEPANTDTCSPNCQTRDCDVIPDGCGDLAVGPGETCDPPGAGACSNLCQAAPCTAAAMGETEIACTEGAAEIAAAASDDAYLLAWTGTHRRPGELLGRRYGDALAPLDATIQILSDGTSCSAAAASPSAASDGSDFAILWGRSAYDYGGSVGRSSPSMVFRDIDGDSSAAGSLRSESVGSPGIGFCSGVWWTLPTTVSGAPSSPYALGWSQVVSRCAYWQTTVGRLFQPDGDPESRSASHGFPVSVYAVQMSNPSVATMRGTGGTALWVTYAGGSDGMGGQSDFVAGTWSDGPTTGSPFSLGSRGVDANAGRPAVAAGTASWLVAWRESSPSEIRAIRVTRAGGRIDADGGFLVAAPAGAVTGGPTVAFDGARWLVAWTEPGAVANDLKAVAIETDGSVVDATPRTLATQVAAQDPALSSRGDGEVLVAFRRDDAGWSAVRALLVTP